jgi:hypothetical protein
VFFQHLQQQKGILGIILGAAGIKGFAKLGQVLGIDGIQQQEVDVHQGIEQAAARLL